ncbi:hypothetical protein [Rhodanobacter sp. DHG33]|uniref:hypothetical protein n=1 Tax=Rhodanobacter sp. DHG33 TaxID=2775921 RepID=UPI001780AB29|nr:hypothetical protein [Rhodanobacter sp. DHG33]MBD8899683.1 hypothetical protein [Rhodanobacter sp. DHG33]
MNEHTFQIALVATGALIGLASSLLAVLLTSHQAKVRHRKSRLAHIHELIGKRCALRGSDPQEEMKVWSKWLKTKDASRLDRIAFMTGFVETNNIQLQEIIQANSAQQAILAESETETARLRQKLDQLIEERAAQESMKSALESKKGILEAKEKQLEQSHRSSQDSTTRGFDSNAT